jgi:hypothetical protein
MCGIAGVPHGASLMCARVVLYTIVCYFTQTLRTTALLKHSAQAMQARLHCFVPNARTVAGAEHEERRVGGEAWLLQRGLG